MLMLPDEFLVGSELHAETGVVSIGWGLIAAMSPIILVYWVVLVAIFLTLVATDAIERAIRRD